MKRDDAIEGGVAAGLQQAAQSGDQSAAQGAGATLFVSLQPVPSSSMLTMLLPVAVLSVTLEGQPTTIPLSEFVTVLPITVPRVIIPVRVPET